MTYYGPKEMAESFRTVRGNTIQIAEEIPEDRYGYRVSPESRTVGETLVHIAAGSRLQQQMHFVERRTNFVGFDFFSFMDKQLAEERAPRTKAQIIEMLRTEGDRFARALEGASEEFLAERLEFPEGAVPPSKTRFEMLLSTKEHEMHHRGQLMVVERLLGIVPHLTRRMQERVAAMKTAQAAH